MGLWFALWLALIPSSGAAQSPELLLEKGRYLEGARGDLAGAIEAYEQLLEKPGRTARVAAQAHLRLGICLRLLGERERANEHFRTVAEAYPDQKPVAELARRHLGTATRIDPARFLPPDALAYIELVHPAEQVRNLAAILEGTPLQNPVDYALTYLTERPGAEEAGERARTDRPPWMRYAAAVLNRGFLNELQKIDGLAFGVPGKSSEDRGHIGVFLPGGSDVLRGMGSLFLSNRAPHASHRSFLVYRYLPEPEGGERAAVYVALREDVLLWGRPREVVFSAIDRYQDGADSLAGNVSFRRARASAPGAIFRAYLGPGWLGALRETLPPRPRERFDSASGILGWRHVHPLLLSAATRPADGSLTFRLQSWIRQGPSHALWSAIRTSPWPAAPAFPSDSGCLLAARTRCEGALDRLRTLLERFTILVDELSGEGERSNRGNLEKLRAALEGGPGRELLSRLDAICVGLQAEPGKPVLTGLWAALEVNDPEGAESALRDVLQKGPGALAGGLSPRPLRSVEIPAGGGSIRFHCLEPLPGLEIGYARQGRFLLLGLSRSAITTAWNVATSRRAALEERGTDEPHEGSDRSVESSVSKAIELRPAALLDVFPAPGLPPGSRLLLEELAIIRLETVETSESLRIDLRIPNASKAMLGVLERVSRRSSSPPPLSVPASPSPPPDTSPGR